MVLKDFFKVGKRYDEGCGQTGFMIKSKHAGCWQKAGHKPFCLPIILPCNFSLIAVDITSLPAVVESKNIREMIFVISEVH